jgi:hypothetical protein
MDRKILGREYLCEKIEEHRVRVSSLLSVWAAAQV